MGKVFRIYLRVEPFAVLVWALGIVLAQPAYSAVGDPARRPGLPQPRDSMAVES